MAGAAILGRPLMWRVGTVVTLRDETATARTITLQVPDWPGHVAGQHLEVRLTAPDGYSAVRSYSIASAPNSDGRVQITVERVPNGEVSPYLTQEVVVGDRLELRGPYGGWFVWRSEQTGPVQLIAGGSGIVPLMAMIRARFSSGSKSQFRLLYSAREVESIFYRDELKALSEDKLGLNVTYVYTRKIPMGWPRPAGRIDANLVANTTWPAVLDLTSYICGPTSFVEAAADLLLATAMKRDNIRTERFGPTGERR